MKPNLYVVSLLLCLAITGCASTPSKAPPDAPMIEIPASQFLMGDSEIGEPDESPAHPIYLDTYHIDQYEISNAQYSLCVKAGVCSAPSSEGSEFRASYFDDPEFSNYPVIFVTWADASTFCEWRGARLPTEAEWEKAARGSQGDLYPWGSEFDPTRLNYCDVDCGLPWADPTFNDGYIDTAPVDAFPSGVSPYDLYNMAGNVWEWVADWYAEDYYSETIASNPPGPSSGTQRVTRGGGFPNDLYYLRASERRRFAPDVPSSSVGFRCAK